MLAAMKCERNSIGVEIDDAYCRMALHRLKTENHDLSRKAEIVLSWMGDNGSALIMQEEAAVYRGKENRKKKAKQKGGRY